MSEDKSTSNDLRRNSCSTRGERLLPSGRRDGPGAERDKRYARNGDIPLGGENTRISRGIGTAENADAENE
jgi:hypothetical protein